MSFVFWILHATVGEGGSLEKYPNPSVGMRQALPNYEPPGRNESALNTSEKIGERIERVPEITMPKYRAIPWSNCFAFPLQA
jgi:hypothetical protein